jgi:hypothetical protein
MCQPLLLLVVKVGITTEAVAAETVGLVDLATKL